jgi:hypothetical protein
MPDLTFIRAEIERMRVQVSRQRKEILTLQKAGINSLPAEALLARMLANIDNMCAERDRLKREQPAKGNVLGRPELVMVETSALCSLVLIRPGAADGSEGSYH